MYLYFVQLIALDNVRDCKEKESLIKRAYNCREDFEKGSLAEFMAKLTLSVSPESAISLMELIVRWTTLP